MQRVDHLVVGAGAMGAATAWQLASRGREVVLVEQFEPGHQRGSSHGATRIFRTSYRDLLYAKLAIDSIDLWHQLQDESGLRCISQDGQIDHGSVLAINEVEATLNTLGRPVERLSAKAAMDRWPGMYFASDVIFSADGGRAFADNTVAALLARVTAQGGQLYESEPVRAISIVGDDAIVESEHHTWRTPSVVVAAGAWVSQLMPRSMQLPPLKVEVLQPVHFLANPKLDTDKFWPAFIHHSEQKTGSLDLGAYGMYTPGEGVKVGVAESNRPAANPDDSQIISEATLNLHREYAQQWLPGVDSHSAIATTGLVTNTPTGHFILDRVGPITVCSPCSGHGFKFVPAIGAITADLAMGGTQQVAQWRLPGN